MEEHIYKEVLADLEQSRNLLSQSKLEESIGLIENISKDKYPKLKNILNNNTAALKARILKFEEREMQGIEENPGTEFSKLAHSLGKYISILERNVEQIINELPEKIAKSMKIEKCSYLHCPLNLNS